MKPTTIMAVLGILSFVVCPADALSLEMESYQIVDYLLQDPEPLYDCYMNYYYYIPCPTASWFWGVSGWEPGGTVGAFFTVGDISMFSGWPCDPMLCHQLYYLTVLDFAGYGTSYPGLYTVEFDVYCSDESGCPVGPSLYNSGAVETHQGWNFVMTAPFVELRPCALETEPVPSYCRFLVTATHTGSIGTYPKWGFDNISSALASGCTMLDQSLRPAQYPRPQASWYSTIHSGYYGVGFEHCPPLWLADGEDTSGTGETYGYIELAWRAILIQDWSGATEPTTWGAIKAMYR